MTPLGGEAKAGSKFTISQASAMMGFREAVIHQGANQGPQIATPVDIRQGEGKAEVNRVDPMATMEPRYLLFVLETSTPTPSSQQSTVRKGSCGDFDFCP